MVSTNILHYKVLEKIGSGGMGEVYLAEDIRLGRRVALKILPSSYQYDQERRERFLREARAASALRSPNVAAIYDIGDTDNTMFIAMEYVSGELLSTRLESGSLAIDQAVDIATQVAEALDEAHSLGIVHRDIKSANLIVTERGLVKVLDFGLAKMTTRANSDVDSTVQLGLETSPGMILGTIAYMSPEQARGQEVDNRSDLFSLGVLFYEMLTGKRPFEGGTTGDLLVSILSDEPEPLSSTAQVIPPEIQWIVTKSLRKDKTLRYQTARDFIVDLKNLAQGLATRVIAPASKARAAASYETRVVQRDSIERDSGVRRRTRKHIDSIAVLPLINSSNDPELDYLSDGITESLINVLSRVPKLRVMARSTVFRYKGRQTDPRQVGNELNVRSVMTGRMSKVRDHFSIRTELVDVSDGSQLWGEQYTKPPSDIASLEDDISNDIAEQLKLKLSSGAKRAAAKKQAKSADAYELYLKGRFNWSKWTEAGFREAIGCYEQAIAKDPNFALAYAGLGECYGVFSYFTPDPAQAQGFLLKSKTYAQQALEIDEALAEAHLQLGNLAHLHEWNRPLAEREFKIALELNPNLANARMGYSFYLMDCGQFDDAIVEMEQALQLDPLSLPVNTGMGFLMFNCRRYDDTLKQLARSFELTPANVLETDPTFQLSHQLAGACFERTGKHDEAVEEYVMMIPDWSRRAEMVAGMREAYRESGIEGFWRVFVGFAEEMTGLRIMRPMFVSSVYASLGANDEAFEWLEKAFAERSPALSHIKVDPRFESLHEDGRFKLLLDRMHLS